ncbi:MAG: hypothetical protein ACK5MD_06335 [Flavobacteriales bacterium]
MGVDNTKVEFYGWQKGVRKIRFIMLLHEKGGISLRESKIIKDKVIGGNEIICYDFKVSSLAKEIHIESIKLGVKSRLV